MLIHAGIENDTQFEGLPSGLNGVLGNTDRSTIGGRLGIKRRGVCLEGEGSLKRIRDDAVALPLLDRGVPILLSKGGKALKLASIGIQCFSFALRISQKFWPSWP